MPAFHPSDVAVVGLGLDIAGAVLLARGFMMKHLQDIQDEVQTVAGGNQFLLKSGLFQRAEARAGGSLLFVGFLLQMLGSLNLFSTSAPRFVVGVHGLLVLLPLSGTVYVTAQQLASRIARGQFYEWKLRGYDGARLFKPPATPQEEEQLRRLARLYDIRTHPGEPMAILAERLNDTVSAWALRQRAKAGSGGASRTPGAEGAADQGVPADERARPTQPPARS